MELETATKNCSYLGHHCCFSSLGSGCRRYNKIAPCLSVEVETEQAEAGSHREGGGGEELLARVDLDLENKKDKNKKI